jgi:hypothetical protein
MEEMYPEIRYIEGKKNTVADFLSRYQGLGVAQIDAGPYRVAELQREDPHCRPIRDKLCEARNPSFVTQIGPYKRQWCLREGVLMIALQPPRAGTTADPRLRVVLPATMDH